MFIPFHPLKLHLVFLRAWYYTPYNKGACIAHTHTHTHTHTRTPTHTHAHAHAHTRVNKSVNVRIFSMMDLYAPGSLRCIRALKSVDSLLGATLTAVPHHSVHILATWQLFSPRSGQHTFTVVLKLRAICCLSFFLRQGSCCVGLAS